MSQLGRGETIEDTARVMSRYCSMIVIRTFEQDKIERLAAASDVPVINALTDYAHPCQSLADLQTIREHKGGLSGLTLTYLGDGNNVAHSLMLAGTAAGMRVRVAAPAGYEPIRQVVQRANQIGEETGGAAVVMNDPIEAATGADVLYTDVWASMGQEAEEAERRGLFAAFQLDQRCVEAANDGALVMHCLPAHRGEEISAEAIDGPNSVVWDEAENRLHAQKALMAFLLEQS
jgi:ornithine carbamoyltransferase